VCAFTQPGSESVCAFKFKFPSFWWRSQLWIGSLSTVGTVLRLRCVLRPLLLGASFRVNSILLNVDRLPCSAGFVSDDSCFGAGFFFSLAFEVLNEPLPFFAEGS